MKRVDPVVFWRCAVIVLLGSAICQVAFHWEKSTALLVVVVGLTLCWVLAFRKVPQ